MLQIVLRTFVGLCDTHGMLGRDEFFEAFHTFAGTLSPADNARLDAAVGSLFEAFDDAGAHEIDLCDLASGVTMLCAGEPRAKLMASLDL